MRCSREPGGIRRKLGVPWGQCIGRQARELNGWQGAATVTKRPPPSTNARPRRNSGVGREADLASCAHLGREAALAGSPKRPSPKRPSPKRPSAKRPSAKRPSAKRPSPKRTSVQARSSVPSRQEPASNQEALNRRSRPLSDFRSICSRVPPSNAQPRLTKPPIVQSAMTAAMMMRVYGPRCRYWIGSRLSALLIEHPRDVETSERHAGLERRSRRDTNTTAFAEEFERLLHTPRSVRVVREP